MILPVECVWWGRERDPDKHVVSAEDKVASWLYRLATGATLLQCSQQFDMTVSHVHRMHKKVSKLFIERCGVCMRESLLCMRGLLLCCSVPDVLLPCFTPPCGICGCCCPLACPGLLVRFAFRLRLSLSSLASSSLRGRACPTVLLLLMEPMYLGRTCVRVLSAVLLACLQSQSHHGRAPSQSRVFSPLWFQAPCSREEAALQPQGLALHHRAPCR